MASPTRPIPNPQVQAFNLAVCERLGIDPEIVGGHNFKADFTVTGDEELGRLSVSFDAYLPADEILAMFNGAGRQM